MKRKKPSFTNAGVYRWTVEITLREEPWRSRCTKSPGEGTLAHKLRRALAEHRGALRFTMGEIMSTLLKIEPGPGNERSLATRIGRIMRKLGYVKKEFR